MVKEAVRVFYLLRVVFALWLIAYNYWGPIPSISNFKLNFNFKTTLLHNSQRFYNLKTVKN